jgi:hypothetical protein
MRDDSQKMPENAARSVCHNARSTLVAKMRQNKFMRELQPCGWKGEINPECHGFLRKALNIKSLGNTIWLQSAYWEKERKLPNMDSWELAEWYWPRASGHHKTNH